MTLDRWLDRRKKFVVVIAFLVTLAIFASFMLFATDDVEDGVFIIGWTFIPTTHADSLVTNFEVWTATFIGEPLVMLSEDIPACDRLFEYSLPSNGATYSFVVRAVQPHAKSDFSDVASVVSENRVKPGTPTDVNVREE